MFIQFKKIKMFIIITILIFSSLFVICSSGMSFPGDTLYLCTPIFDIDYNKTLTSDPIVPYSEPKKIPIILKSKIDGPEVDVVLEFASGVNMIVDIFIAGVPEGCHAAVNPPFITFNPSAEFISENISISVTIDQYLPAFSLKTIKLGIRNRRLGGSATVIESVNVTFDIPIVVGYLPQLSFSYENSNVKSIVPDQTAYFIIEMQNWGNADTKVWTEIEDIPEGWQANIVENTTLGTILFGGDPATISLNVKPPISFGYHEDRAIIKVKMTPVFYNDSSYSGEPHYLNFIVQSKGFSSPGFETILILLAFVLIFFVFWIRKNKMGGIKK